MNDQRLRLLIIGGYGTFGGRLAELLCRERRVSLVIAGRSKSAALDFCHALPPGAAREALAVDRDGDVARRIEKVNPDIVVDASGPFQAYGKDPYRVVKAALATRTHYLDLADSPDFVRGIRQFDGTAKEQGLVMLSGVSSFPVLSAAMVRDLATEFGRIDSIAGGIAPSPYAGVGYNVIRAIAGYAGKGIPLRRQGSGQTARALLETRRFTIAPPGEIPLFPRTFSLVDVPDLQLLADEWPEVKDVWMGAAPEPAILHWLLRRFAGLVRLGLVPSLAPLARIIHSTANNVRWGEHRGGMFVEVRGRGADGAEISRSAQLLAEGHHGLYIPSMAVEAIVRNWLDGRPPKAGARPATAELELSEYARVFANRPISIGTRNGAGAGVPCLHKRILGTAWQSLPAVLRAVHGAGPKLTISGEASITRGRGCWRACWRGSCGFPPPAKTPPCR
ncbi:MAG: saccharopine dehydrogenase NADP-binding domain-containing protein [Gammaproteobacteria bacterium]|nr:saccharopine dehydrogenase NADP-binding domain-containing protein [Gammaproteobacteria bacterium]